jgi:hypothetical protein
MLRIALRQLLGRSIGDTGAPAEQPDLQGAGLGGEEGRKEEVISTKVLK